MQFNFTNKNFVSVKNSEGTKLGRINLKKGEFQVSKDNNPRGDEQEVISQFLDGIKSEGASITNLWPLIKVLNLIGLHAKETGSKFDKVQLDNLTKAVRKLKKS